MVRTFLERGHLVCFDQLPPDRQRLRCRRQVHDAARAIQFMRSQGHGLEHRQNAESRSTGAAPRRLHVDVDPIAR